MKTESIEILSQQRHVTQITEGIPATDGAGVKLTRLIGSPTLNHADPFLLLDAFETSNPDDYIAGFPAHPHRGFETVTYMLEGRLRHEDSSGHKGLLQAGGVQWMTAGRGVVHSEMPEQEDGRMAGFQLWLNLPASLKMSEPRYQEFSDEQLPVEHREKDVVVKVIAGETSRGTRSPFTTSATAPIYYDVSLPIGSIFSENIAADQTAFVFTIAGEITVHGEHANDDKTIPERHLALLSHGEQLQISGQHQQNRFLLIAANPINEPIARGGPFVMNTKAEIEQAFRDYRDGNFLTSH